eukprot:3781012-Pyramimonas_sp.AAC.1
MTELAECKRAGGQDNWFLAVQGQFRRGELSERARIFFAWQTDGCAGVVGERCAVARERPLRNRRRGACEAERAGV